jgi:hypothetical protein
MPEQPTFSLKNQFTRENSALVRAPEQHAQKAREGFLIFT